MGSTPWAEPLVPAHRICPQSSSQSTLHHPEGEGGTTTATGPMGAAGTLSGKAGPGVQSLPKKGSWGLILKERQGFEEW